MANDETLLTAAENGTNGTNGDKQPTGGQGRRISLRTAIPVLCVLLVIVMLLTYAFTAEAMRRSYTAKLAEQQKLIEQLKSEGYSEAQNFQLLNTFLELYSYYSDTMDDAAMMEAAFKAYVAASGDDYARYYTEEEYLAMHEQNVGDYCGIGVTVTNTSVEINGQSYLGFRVSYFAEGSSGVEVGMAVGDLIYAVERNGSMETVNSIGYDAALQAVRGEEGSTVRMMVFRKIGEDYTPMEFTLIRRKFETLSVRSSLYEQDPTIGIVAISSFDLTTPKQFKQAVNGLLEQGVDHFVFDVRNNPGGDLQSIKAVLSYFLKDGDLILSAIDKDGKVAASYHAEAKELTGDYASCSVAPEELGMYADLDIAVLCNKATASAAEVFTATLRDYGLATLVGKTTFGKGIMQTTMRIPFRNLVAYIKLTTHAYVTQCGESYHGSGVEPHISVEQGKEAEGYSPIDLPQSLDQQLKTAVLVFQNEN